jgi:hypothetical protein
MKRGTEKDTNRKKLGTKKNINREILIPSNDAQIALQAASDLGIEATTAEVRGAGGGALTSLVLTALGDPLIQGVFLGFLVARGVHIEYKKEDGLVITITNLKTLQRVFHDIIG